MAFATGRFVFAEGPTPSVAAPPVHSVDKPGGSRPSSSRRRSDPYYRKLWLGDWRTVLIANLSLAGSAVELIVITAPGANELPWDESVCRNLGPHRHSGSLGCRVIPSCAHAWNKTAERQWSRLHRSAATATRRKTGQKFRYVARAWEPQQRGANHMNVVVARGTAAEIATATCYRRELAARAGRYGFGFVDRKRNVKESAHAAMYVAKYLSENAGKLGIGDLAADDKAPVIIARVSRELTMLSGITMRQRREVRIHYAMGQNLSCEPHEAAVIRSKVLAYARHRRQVRDDWRRRPCARSGLVSLEEVATDLDPGSTADHRWRQWTATATTRAAISALLGRDEPGTPSALGVVVTD